MLELNKKEMFIRYGAIGFVLGLVITITEFGLILFARATPFSFAIIARLHADLPLLYMIDFLAIPAMLSGIFIANWRYQQLFTLSERIRQETDKNEEIRQFTHALIAGDLNSPVELILTEQSLSDTLNKLKETLTRNREIERQRRLDDRQRNWISEGLAEFGDILRKHSMELDIMTYALISGLVRYLEANQGAIFLARESGGERFLEMAACHAYGRKKYPDKRVAWGDGLIGAAALERKGYYTDKIKDGYLTITSGLGKANPSYLLIEPLVWNDKVFGVIEMASFNRFEEYKIHFVQRIAENIATTINTMESNLRTEQLLKETRAQADRMVLQDEQMRQNMEALKRAQEEGAKQAETFIGFTNTVNHTLMRAEYNTDGNLLYANTRFLKKLGYSGNREVEGKHISMFINEKDREWFDSIWTRLSRGGRHFEGYMKHETKMGQDLWTMATYTCERRDDGSVEKILFLAIDSTEQKKQSLDYEGQIDAIDRLNAKAVFSPDGKLQISNTLFGNSLKYTDMELAQMNVFDFFGTSEQERFNEIWENVIRGEAFQGQLKMQSKFGEELWFRATFLSVNDMYGEVEKVIFLANEISKEKEMELASRKQHDKLVRKEEELRLATLDLKKKLEETNLLWKQEITKFEKAIKQYVHVMEELPFSLITINNQGFILFFNRHAERRWKMKQKDVIGNRVEKLFHPEHSSDIINGFMDPARSKKTGIFSEQEFQLPGKKSELANVMLISTDLEDEMLYSLIILQ
jgi:PAS domain S-box-containing protein